MFKKTLVQLKHKKYDKHVDSVVCRYNKKLMANTVWQVPLDVQIV